MDNQNQTEQIQSFFANYSNFSLVIIEILCSKQADKLPTSFLNENLVKTNILFKTILR